MCFAPSKRNMLIRDWIGLKLNLLFSGQQLGEVDRFGYLGNHTSPGGHMWDEIFSLMQ